MTISDIHDSYCPDRRETLEGSFCTSVNCYFLADLEVFYNEAFNQGVSSVYNQIAEHGL